MARLRSENHSHLQSKSDDDEGPAAAKESQLRLDVGGAATKTTKKRRAVVKKKEPVSLTRGSPLVLAESKSGDEFADDLALKNFKARRERINDIMVDLKKFCLREGLRELASRLLDDPDSP